jgi:hypothetical protein
MIILGHRATERVIGRGAIVDEVVSGSDRPPGELLTESSESKRAKR